jgi:type VI protein secretion system component Hcp
MSGAGQQIASVNESSIFFMQVPNVTGPSTDTNFPGQFELAGLSFAGQNPRDVKALANSNLVTGTPSFSEIQCTINDFDPGTLLILQGLCTGVTYNPLVISCCQRTPGGGTAGSTALFTISLENAGMNQQTVAMGYGGRPVCTFSINYTKITVAQTEGGGIQAGYDMALNQAVN